MHGVHLFGDLLDCACAHVVMVDPTQVSSCIAHACETFGLTIVGNASHAFANGGFTLAVLLAESHITVHTWPEHSSVAIDVYVCNFTRDNSAAARAVANALIAVFDARSPQLREIVRGERRHADSAVMH